ncbi:hypothetical protein O166_02710 [Pseudogulbenkiania ferrooxidans EGD-HP2]|uniref:Uncharacterized protein n=1 Tax=Pseudogulbenkiania ferrooxidans EGD-HP2 TaxID=1388764 RepID=A0ABP2XRA8_9NEIS|nr:hypothetical protein O166_02710 [Pseudogulbenkiania ferrooxidans EGD-HP2]
MPGKALLGAEAGGASGNGLPVARHDGAASSAHLRSNGRLSNHKKI